MSGRDAVHRALPPVLAAIADAAGVDAALAVAGAMGGRHVTIPSDAQGDNWLTRIVSEAEAAAIIAALGATKRIDMPMGPGAGYFARRREQLRRMHELTLAGQSAAAIARATGTTERSVRRWWQRWRWRDPRQSDLFG